MPTIRNGGTSRVIEKRPHSQPKLMTLYRAVTSPGLASRVERLFVAALRTWKGDQVAAETFLKSSNPSLDGAAPIALAASEAGTRRVEEMLGRVEHGVLG